MKAGKLAILAVTFSISFDAISQGPVLHIASPLVGEIRPIPGRPYWYSVEENSFRIWDLDKGVELAKFYVDGVRESSVSSDGNNIAVLGHSSIILYSFLENKTITIGNDSTYLSHSFSEKNEILLLKKHDVEVWNLSGNRIGSYPFAFDYGKYDQILEYGHFTLTKSRIIINYQLYNKIYILDYVKGATKILHCAAWSALTISNDGNYIAYFGNNKIHCFDLANLGEVASFSIKNSLSVSISGISISKDNRIVTTSYDRKNWDLHTGIELSFDQIKAYQSEIEDQDGDSTIFKNAAELRALSTTRSISEIRALQNGRYLFILGLNGSLVWDFALNKGVIQDKIDSIRQFLESVPIAAKRKGSVKVSVLTSPNSWTYYYANGNSIVYTEKDSRRGCRIDVYNKEVTLIASYDLVYFRDWFVSENGSRLNINDLGIIEQTEIGSKVSTKNCYLKGGIPRELLFSNSGKYFVYHSQTYPSDREGFLVDANTTVERKISEFDLEEKPNDYEDVHVEGFAGRGSTEIVRKKTIWRSVQPALVFAPSENHLLFSNSRHVIKQVDVQTASIVREFKGHLHPVVTIEYLNDSIFISADKEGSIKFWNLHSGKELANLVILDSINWVVTTPAGLFDATPGAMSEVGIKARMYYVVTDTTDRSELFKVININQLKQRYYQPGLLSIVLGFSKEPLREVPALGSVEFAPRVKLNLENDDLLIDLDNKGGGIGKVSVFVEGSELVEDAMTQEKNASDGTAHLRLDLGKFRNRFVTGQDNRIKVVAWNKAEWLSSEPANILYKPIPIQSKGAEADVPQAPKKEVSFYAVVVGTSNYSGEKIDLKFASKDAQDFYQALKNSADQLFLVKKPELHLFTTDALAGPQYPSKQNIVNSLKLLSKTEPQDVMVLYLSGHGVNYGGQDGDFYYLTSQCSGADANYLKDQVARDNYTISSKELTKLLNDIPARKKVLILDACASGKAAEVMVTTTRDVPASQVRSLDKLSERTGFYVLSGSAADAVSYETSIYGQGLLTYALLKAIKGAALRIDGGEEYVDVQQLLQFAVDEVPNLAKGIGGIQQPLFRSPDNQRSYRIGKVTKEVKEQIILAEPKPIFVSSNFQDEQSFDKLEFSNKIDAQLRDITARGRQANVVFTEGKDYPDAFRIVGSYKEEGSKIVVTYRIGKNSKVVAGPFVITGDPKNIDALVTDLLKGVGQNIK